MSEYQWESPHRNYVNWHKGQIHCHNQASVAEVLDHYREAKYAFACVTPHNHSSPDVQRDGILHIRSGEDGRFHRHHILALGINFSRVDPNLDGDRDGISKFKTCPCANIGARLDYYTNVQGTVAVLAHPRDGHRRGWFSCPGGWTLEELKQYANEYTGIEIYNATTGDCCAWWDEVLRSGKRVWGFGSDDMHDLDSRKHFNRSWIVVNSERSPAEQWDILANIKAGNFHTVVRDPDVTGEPGGGELDWIGPELYISVEENCIRVETDEDSHIGLIGSRNGVPTAISASGPGRSLVYHAQEGDQYFRAVVRRTQHERVYASSSQPILRGVIVN